MPPRTPQTKDTKLYIDKLESSGIDNATAKKLGYKHLTAQETKQLGVKHAIQSMLIPYYGLDGKPRKFFRVRYLEGTKKGFAKQTDAKEQRYDQPSLAPEVYFPPLLNWSKYLADAGRPLFITEGEYKAACATARGYPCIALGGVWNFCSRRNGVALLPVFDELNLAGRDVYVIYDSDSVSKPQVIMAENELCRQLTTKKARPLVVRLPTIGDSKKTGLDDYLLSDEAENFEQLLAQAQPWAQAEALLRLNEEVIYVENPSLVIRRNDGYKMGVPTFKNEVYSHKNYLDTSGDKPKKLQTAAEWVKWEGRAQVNGMDYRPGQPEFVVQRGRTSVNLWRPLPVQPVKGSVVPWLALMDYVFKDEPKSRKWFEQWLAYPLQHLGSKLYTAAAIWSVETGTGKTLIGHTMQRLYGDNSIMVRKRDLVSGDNSYAENKQFILGEEITGSDKRDISDELKGLITNEEIRINIKYVPTFTTMSCANYYFTSNNPDAFFIDEKDRRIMVHEITGDPLEEAWYIDVYDKWYKSDEGASALLHYFLNLDTSDFSPKGKAPMTRAKEHMIESSRSHLANWIHKLRENPEQVLQVAGGKLNYSLYTADDLLQIFDPDGKGRVGVRAIGVELSRAKIPRAAHGMPCRTKYGQLRLWALYNSKQLAVATQKEVGELFDRERAAYEKVAKFAKKGKGTK